MHGLVDDLTSHTLEKLMCVTNMESFAIQIKTVLPVKTQFATYWCHTHLQAIVLLIVLKAFLFSLFMIHYTVKVRLSSTSSNGKVALAAYFHRAHYNSPTALAAYFCRYPAPRGISRAAPKV
jgi:hypothetical protein